MEKPPRPKTINERRKDDALIPKNVKVDMAAFEERRKKARAFTAAVGTYVHPVAGAMTAYAVETVQPAPEVKLLYTGDDWKSKAKRLVLQAGGAQGTVGLAKGIRDQLENPEKGITAISEAQHSYESYKKIQAEQAGKYIKQGDGHTYPALMPDFEILD